jgi:hypothetical protein
LLTSTKDQPVTRNPFIHAGSPQASHRAAARCGYLLLSNIVGDEPGHLWWLYLQLPEIERHSRN